MKTTLPLLFLFFILIASINGEKKIKSIQFHTKRHDITKILKDSLLNRPPSIFKKAIKRYPQYVERFREIDLNTIKRDFLSQGYMDVKVSDSLENLSRKLYKIHYHIEEGKQYLTGEIILKNNRFISRKKITSKFKSTPEKPFSRENLAKDSLRLIHLYQNRGFFDISLKIIKNISQDSLVELTFVIKEGVRYRIENILYEGNTKINKWLIRRELEFHIGEFYSYSQIKKSQDNLFESGFFSYVNILPEKTSHNGKINLKIIIEERKTRSLLFNLNYEQFEQQSSNIYTDISYTIRNLFENGWVLTLNPSYSFNVKDPSLYRKYDINLIFLENWFLNFKLPFTFNPSFSDLKTDLYHYREYGTTFRFRNKVTQYGSLVNTIKIKKKNFQGTLTDEIADEVGEGYHTVWELILEKDTRDNIFDPHKGSYFKIQQSIAGWWIGNENNYYKWTMNWCRYKGKAKARLKLGFAGSMKKGDPFPLEERFFGGGANSWHGYGDRKIGYYSKSLDKYTGGELLILGNFIFHLWEWKFLRQVFLLDGGNIYLDWEHIDIKDQKIGIGTGWHIITPIGPIRFEFAFPLDKRQDKKNLNFHFAFMPMF